MVQIQRAIIRPRYLTSSAMSNLVPVIKTKVKVEVVTYKTKNAFLLKIYSQTIRLTLFASSVSFKDG